MEVTAIQGIALPVQSAGLNGRLSATIKKPRFQVNRNLAPAPHRNPQSLAPGPQDAIFHWTAYAVSAYYMAIERSVPQT